MKILHLDLLACLLPSAVGVITLVQPSIAATFVSELGNLSSISSIVADTQVRAAAGDASAAMAKITEFETALEQAAAGLRVNATARPSISAGVL